MRANLSAQTAGDHLVFVRLQFVSLLWPVSYRSNVRYFSKRTQGTDDQSEPVFTSFSFRCTRHQMMNTLRKYFHSIFNGSHPYPSSFDVKLSNHWTQRTNYAFDSCQSHESHSSSHFIECSKCKISTNNTEYVFIYFLVLNSVFYTFMRNLVVIHKR